MKILKKRAKNLKIDEEDWKVQDNAQRSGNSEKIEENRKKLQKKTEASENYRNNMKVVKKCWKNRKYPKNKLSKKAENIYHARFNMEMLENMSKPVNRIEISEN